MNQRLVSRLLFSTVVLGLFSLSIVVPGFAHEGHDSDDQLPNESRENVTVKGEIIDLVCYLDHKAQGEKHAGCAKACIESGLPVGIKSENGKVYLLVGEHKPLNPSLAQYAAKTITLKGKLVNRDGFNMLENVEIIGKNSQ